MVRSKLADTKNSMNELLKTLQKKYGKKEQAQVYLVDLLTLNLLTMSFVKKPEVLQALSPQIAYTQPCSFSFSAQDYEDQIIAYFSDISSNAVYQLDTEKLKRRFEAACKQVERFVLLQEEE